MPISSRFSNDQLVRIMDEASVYLCACPAQLCRQILGLRGLYDYQEDCLSGNDTNAEVHRLIAEATEEAHARLEVCLDEILTLEDWDRLTLKMPEGLRQLRDSYLLSLGETGE
jgi:hypothetical protein